VSEKVTTRVLYEAGQARTAANCQDFPLQTLAFSAPTILWSRNLSQERYNYLESAPKKEIPV
jgi:hypothetical protein